MENLLISGDSSGSLNDPNQLLQALCQLNADISYPVRGKVGVSLCLFTDNADPDSSESGAQALPRDGEVESDPTDVDLPEWLERAWASQDQSYFNRPKGNSRGSAAEICLG
ncbi:hypothetical protein NPIL_110551 [Nephila pilipes]|uniref:Uncharacterized protein n=1 Tax=Nephila pilipes TaxID=299642 RepID=A0A8X6Q8R0_NEPPI|nr:hypothetical protein NPIL_110551 [Nephila pilipes]